MIAAMAASERRSVPRRPRRVAILAFPQVQSLDVTGPLEVFDAATRLLRASASRDPGYEVLVVSRGGGPVRSTSGLALVPHAALEQVTAPLHTLIVAGGTGHRRAAEDAGTLEWIADTARRARRTASVCTGAFLLARAGLLSGRRATTHWSWAERLKHDHPDVLVDPEPIFIRDGRVWTSAGVTAGMDLALALVEEDHDRELALAIARQLVLFLRRPGNQTQFSATLAAQEPERESLREVQRYVVEHVSENLSVEALAERAHMSPRNFARAFAAETGITPGRYVERVRLEAARRALEDSAEPVASVAAKCGFGTAETMRRAFLRALGVAPAEYRRRYHPAGARDATVAA
jgi:transcriptional regulator GlxA family with amidase domain